MRRVRNVKTPTRTKVSRPKTRSRAVKATTRSGVKETKPKKGFDRGAAGFAKAEEKRQRQEEEYERRRETPYDFRLKPGDEAEIILLDDQEPFFVTLHKVKSGNRWEDEICIADQGERCPLCEMLGKEGSYTMVATCLDRRPYKVQSGPNAGKVIKASKRLLKVKGRNMPKFKRAYDRANGNFRGLKVLCHRDGDKEAAIGEDIEFLGRVKESFLQKFRDNATPADYEKIFAIPTAEELRKRYKIPKNKVAGSEEFENTDEDEDDADMENVGWK